MKYTLNITNENFEIVDFSEGCLLFDCPSIINNKVSFQVWGATLMDVDKNPCFTFLNKEKEKYLYIAGLSTINIEEAVGGAINICLFHPARPKECINLDNGELFRLKRDWKYYRSPDLYEYLWECNLDWPHGDCSLLIAAKGNVTMEFDTADCISATEYVLNPQKYGFRKGDMSASE